MDKSGDFETMKPQFGRSVVRGPAGPSRRGFHPGVLYPKVSSPKGFPTRLHLILDSTASYTKEAILELGSICVTTKRVLTKNSASALIRLPSINILIDNSPVRAV